MRLLEWARARHAHQPPRRDSEAVREATALVTAEIELEVGLSEGTASTSIDVHDDLQQALNLTGAQVLAVFSYDILPAEDFDPDHAFSEGRSAYDPANDDNQEEQWRP